MDTRQIEAAITERTRAILPVHLYGQPADMDPILDIARRHKLMVIEDAAQAHGAEYRERRVGSIGDLACFSFYPTKNLGAAGEGGMVTTNNPDYARTVASLRNWGEDHRYHPVLKGYNYRMAGLQAAVLRVKFRRLEPWTEARRALAAKYDRLLEDSAVTRPHAAGDVRHIYCLYTIRSRGSGWVAAGAGGGGNPDSGALSPTDSPYACLRRREIQGRRFSVRRGVRAVGSEPAFTRTYDGR